LKFDHAEQPPQGTAVKLKTGEDYYKIQIMKKQAQKKLVLKQVKIATLLDSSQHKVKGGGDPDTYSAGITRCGTSCRTTSNTNTGTVYPQAPPID